MSPPKLYCSSLQGETQACARYAYRTCERSGSEFACRVFATPFGVWAVLCDVAHGANDSVIDMVLGHNDDAFRQLLVNACLGEDARKLLNGKNEVHDDMLGNNVVEARARIHAFGIKANMSHVAVLTVSWRNRTCLISDLPRAGNNGHRSSHLFVSDRSF